MMPRKKRAKLTGKTRPKKHQPPGTKDSTPPEELPSREEMNGDLPPKENIRKHPDEVYGDTEIPFRP